MTDGAWQVILVFDQEKLWRSRPAFINQSRWVKDMGTCGVFEVGLLMFTQLNSQEQLTIYVCVYVHGFEER